MNPTQAHRASATDTTSMNPWAASIIFRRSILSASAPAGSDSSMIGSVTDAWTSATSSALPIEVIIHEAPTDWIRPPELEARLAIQTERKIGLFRGEKSEGTEGGATGTVYGRG